MLQKVLIPEYLSIPECLSIVIVNNNEDKCICSTSLYTQSDLQRTA